MYNIDKTSNDGKYLVSVKIPMDMGWINSCNFNVDGFSFPLKHIKNENGYAYFSSSVSLLTKAIYHFYFSFLVNDRVFFINKDNNISSGISFFDMDKISVNFEVPEWAKGKIIYHIFVDIEK